MKKQGTQKKISPLRWIAGHTKSQIGNILLIVVFYAVLALIGVYSALLARGVIDSAVAGEMQGVVFYGCVYGGLLLFQLLLRVVTKNIYFYIGAKLTVHYRKTIFNTIIRKDYFKVSSFHSGELLNRITNDVAVVADAVVSILPSFSFMVTKLVGALSVLIAIDWRFTLIFIAGASVLLVVSRAFRSKMKKLHKQVQQTEGKVRSFMQEILSGLLMVKVFGAEDKVDQRASQLQEDNYRIKVKRNRISVIAGTSFSFIFSAGYLYGLLWGAVHIVAGTVTYGTLTAVLSLIGQIQNPVAELSGLLPKYYGALASAERLMELERFPDEAQINDGEMDMQQIYRDLQAIVFKNISFQYDRDLVLKNASLTLQKGTFAVIMGMSGIGKSTLTKLLMGVYPLSGGSIYFKLKDGRQIPVDKSIRRLYAYVPQGNFLLSGTIRDNIAFVCPQASDEDVLRAAKISCAQDFIEELPNGLDTVVGERGQGLSEGQIQRVAIARAILTDAPILILDEATSALDEATEQKLLENIKTLNQKTCIIVSHKKAALSVCDRRIEIIDGKIVCSEMKPCRK
ncbi:MAG TPA: ABC transporter ATP-binding protein [Candidatus Scatovicinus merdipullorum]|nr:ABC transporter ATP-binding protein [Candidatus Scatovicinus merdipullorum]